VIFGDGELGVVVVVGVDERAVGKGREARRDSLLPMMLLLPAQSPSASVYCFTNGASVETDPASARPTPSRIDF
jgi:hypothetical protein